MEVFRISKALFANSLTALGSANRWNMKGQFVIYAGSSRALSITELIVHRKGIDPIAPYKIMVISVADEDDLVDTIDINNLPVNWRSLAGYSALQKIGSVWYLSQKSLLLKVPSAVVPYEYNYIINTEHPAFTSKVQLLRIEDYEWDSRLL